MAQEETFDPSVDVIKQVNTLGTLRLRHPETRNIILIPTPSQDPNDPLNWYVVLEYAFNHSHLEANTFTITTGLPPSSTMSQLLFASACSVATFLLQGPR